VRDLITYANRLSQYCDVGRNVGSKFFDVDKQGSIKQLRHQSPQANFRVRTLLGEFARY
jgi:chaperonin cofactor prefoldin